MPPSTCPRTNSKLVPPTAALGVHACKASPMPSLGLTSLERSSRQAGSLARHSSRQLGGGPERCEWPIGNRSPGSRRNHPAERAVRQRRIASGCATGSHPRHRSCIRLLSFGARFGPKLKRRSAPGLRARRPTEPEGDRWRVRRKDVLGFAIRARHSCPEGSPAVSPLAAGPEKRNRFSQPVAGNTPET